MIQEPTAEQVQKWGEAFQLGIKEYPTTKKTWKEIQKAGIELPAWMLLFGYANGSDALRDFLYRNSERSRPPSVNDRIKAALRAWQVADGRYGAQKRANKLRFEALARRADEAVKRLEETPWCNPYSPHKTVGEFFKAHPEIRSLGPTRKAGDALRRFDNKPLLLILRDYASHHGVRLGLKKLASLAIAARPKFGICPENLSRFFALPEVKACASEWLSVTRPRLDELAAKQRTSGLALIIL